MALRPPVAMWKSFRELVFWCRNTGLEEVLRGAGSPEGVITADRGTIYLRTDGSTNTTLYVKTADDGQSTGWTAK